MARWIASLLVAASIGAACTSPEPDLTGEVTPSPFQEALDARIEITLDVVGSGTVEQDVTDIRPGRPVRLTAMPELGHRFIGWSGDGSGTDNPLVVESETDVAITATFEPIPPIGPEFTINVEGEGFVSRRSGPVVEGEIFLRAIPANGWEFTGWTGMVENDTNPVALPTRQPNEITANFAPVGGVAINVWGGDAQRFELGVPQRWVNVNGNVSPPEQVQSLTYTVNGIQGQTLTLGPDRRRLADPGDFNIELDSETLERGRNDIQIIATTTAGGQVTEDITVDFVDAEWPLPYATNWAAAGAIEDQAQVVDGIWSVGAEGIRTEQIGYDRLVAIGDIEWTDYEATFTVTIHDDDPRGYDPTSEPFVGIVLRWPGHNQQDEESNEQPRWFYWPAGSLSGYYLALDGTSEVRLETNESIMQDDEAGFVMDFDTTYAVRARVEGGPGGADHRLKIWPAAEDEPLNWTVDEVAGTNDIGTEGGSLLLVAHYFDVTFGDVEVTPLS
ncbi:MAG: hypothetical protein AAF548_15310 [Actinomycetota bacterium]